MKKKIKIYGWLLEINISLGRNKKPSSRVCIQPVLAKSMAEKFAYALKLYNELLYNPVFKDMQHVLEALRDEASALSDIYLLEKGTVNWMGRCREREQALDKIICEVHQFVESIQDKESAFILSVGMKPYYVN